jgi:hypothetical protein
MNDSVLPEPNAIDNGIYHLLRPLFLLGFDPSTATEEPEQQRSGRYPALYISIGLYTSFSSASLTSLRVSRHPSICIIHTSKIDLLSHSECPKVLLYSL